MVGGIIIKVAFAAALVSLIAYFYSFRSRSSSLLPVARGAFHAAVISVFLTSALLIYLILTHQFQYSYVWNYSSTDLPTPLLLSTFYAGQEGSFLLWALFTSILGIFLLGYSSRKGYEAEVMSVYSMILAFLLVMLIVKNPFAYIWDTFPNELIHTGPVPPIANFVWLDQAKGIWAQYPAQGKGLNPLLQNYWMVIHPQILFVGFTAMSVPYTFALAGLMRRDYHSWVKVAKPWTVFAAAALGTGIMLGGFWAYETLGWGGFWGWDPVENSSLIPWLVCLASIHTMMAQRRSGTFVRTNFVLGIFCFVFVLYSTFLTRSGVLGDTSVHSFVDPGMWAYWLLLGCIITFTTVGLGLLFVRMKEIPKVSVEHSFMSREFALFLGASAIVFVSVFVLIGTSAPIITGILQGKETAVDVSFYVTTTLPIGIVIALLIGMGQLLWWRNSKTSDLLRSLLYPALSAFVFTVGLVVYGMRDVLMILFTFTSAFALFVNLVVGYRIFKGNPKYAGGAIAHIGIALMFLGFVSSERYDHRATVSLEKGKTVEVLNGYKLTYVGYRSIERDRYAFNVEVEREGRRFLVAPIMYHSDFNNSLMRHPDVRNLVTKDFYLSPLSLETADETAGKQITLKKGESTQVEGVSLTFVDFDFSDVQKGGMLEGGEFTIGAILEVRKGKEKETLVPTMKGGSGKMDYISAASSVSGLEFTIVRIMPDQENKVNSKVELSLRNPEKSPAVGGAQKAETLIVEASVKPFINLVWVGTLTMAMGFIVTIVRRAQEARRAE